MILFRRIALLALLALPAGAQNLIPINNQTINWLSQITQWLDTLVSQHIDLFVGEGINVLTALATILLVYYSILWLLAAGPFPVERLVEFLIMFLFAYTMLEFYDRPLPWSPYSFHQIFSEEARWLAATIDLTSLDDLLNAIKQVLFGIQPPGPLNIIGMFIYAGVVLNLIILYLLSFGITAYAYCALGFFALIGPICIPFFIFPSLSFIFWGWLRLMLTYSFFRVAASAILYVWTHVMVYFIQTVIAGDYSIGHFMWILPIFAALVLSFAFCLFRIDRWCHALFGSGGQMGNMMGGVARAVTAAAAFFI